jgi:hypothetical protein
VESIISNIDISQKRLYNISINRESLPSCGELLSD